MNEKRNTRQLQYLIEEITEPVYRYQKQVYWEADFINRCTDRLHQQMGLCNLPYETLSEETELLQRAYQCYEDLADCNVAYNDTLDTVIDTIEQEIVKGAFSPAENPFPQVTVLIDDGIIGAVYSSDSSVRVQIVELDMDYTSYQQKQETYEELDQNPELQRCEYELTLPGFEDESELEV